MNDKPLSKDDLVTFFRLKTVINGDYRALARVLKALDIRLMGGTTRWSVVWRALRLAPEQDPRHVGELTEPLLDARSAATLLGVDRATIYAWARGNVAADTPPFPTAIDLARGREKARGLRWRKSEVLAWHCRAPIPVYARAAPVFGALTPTIRGCAAGQILPSDTKNAVK